MKNQTDNDFTEPPKGDKGSEKGLFPDRSIRDFLEAEQTILSASELWTAGDGKLTEATFDVVDRHLGAIIDAAGFPGPGAAQILEALRWIRTFLQKAALDGQHQVAGDIKLDRASDEELRAVLSLFHTIVSWSESLGVGEVGICFLAGGAVFARELALREAEGIGGVQ